ncbi:cysteine-rich repeat secretory protein 38 [Quercus suber]|uniref:Cysteine-rich repeat secretory protein 38 n=1 Tax=Quercus suber TaxID=58331 RepID=A0AAW0KYD3_QUESU
MSSHADVNANTGLQCSKDDYSATENGFQTNLNNLFSSPVNGALQNGFYKTTAAKNSDKVYGLIQCRGDISGNSCAGCTNNSITVALHDCPKSKEVWMVFFALFSTEDFFGVMVDNSVALMNETDYDDLAVISNGLSFLSGLASTAPKQPLMFQTAVMDVGQSGKSALEISVALSIDCGKCLDAQLVTLRTIIGSKRGWEIYGSSCFMWYHDFQFYSNISITASEFCGYTLSLDFLAVDWRGYGSVVGLVIWV